MALFDSVKGTVSSAVDTISSVAQSLVEKNRTNAKLNRLRTIMKNESELMNRAYIALGKHYYESVKNGSEIKHVDEKKIFEVIETSKAKIAKARDCYRKIVDSQNDIFYGTPDLATEYDSADVVDITVACSNENEYDSSPFDVVEAEQPEAAETKPAETPQADEDSDKSKKEKVDFSDIISSAKDDEPADDDESPNSELF